MTKEEAIKAMSEGKKVTHRYFSPDEWATIVDGKILLEDGVRCSITEFFKWRQDPSFDTEWSLWKNKI